MYHDPDAPGAPEGIVVHQSPPARGKVTRFVNIDEDESLTEGSEKLQAMMEFYEDTLATSRKGRSCAAGSSASTTRKSWSTSDSSPKA